jgi:hypothetical protein
MRADRPSDPDRSRERMLRRAGMAPRLAASVAADPRYDVHQVAALLEQGCPEQLALRIVAPDDALPLSHAREGRTA